MNIALIGYRGSGKSSIGRQLAKFLWMEFVDTDALVAGAAGKTIREIFDAQGEAGFRECESAAVAQAAAKDNHVIALGGGVVLHPQNIAALRPNAKIIYLKSDAKTLHARIQADPQTAATRPNLAIGGIAGSEEEVRTILEQRVPLYEAAADITLDVTYLTIEDAAKRLVTMI